MDTDEVLLIALAGLAFAGLLSLPMFVRAWRVWRQGPPDFHADRSANDREW